MSFSIVHLSDPHFGEDADLQKTVAVEHLVPDLQPDAVVVTGDLTERARHGEFQAARAWVRELERTAPVIVVPGDHDMQWWTRPVGAPDTHKQFENFAKYFGPVLTPTVELTDAVIAGVNTMTGVQWRLAVRDPRESVARGNLDRVEAQRLRDVFKKADHHVARVVVMHHNVIDDGRVGLKNSNQAQQWLSEASVDLVLCGHTHKHRAEVVNGIVFSTAGSFCSRLAENVDPSFHRIVVEPDAVQVELYRWERDKGHFRRTDVFAFARQRADRGAKVTAGSV